VIVKTTSDTRSIRFFFGSGGAANGIAQNGIAYFLLVYYNQVLGLPASSASLVLMIALFSDAITDPVVGYLSDNWKSRWGRRHPFIYFSIIPMGLFYSLLWNVPSWVVGETALFFYLLVCIVGFRFALTCFQIPSMSLAAELSSDYDERTRLYGARTSADWCFGTVMAIVIMAYWLQETAEYSAGVQNLAGYRESGWVSALFICGSILISALGLHRFIPRLKALENPVPAGLRSFLRQLSEALSERSLRVMIFVTMLNAVAAGAAAALWIYIAAFFWELSNDQTAWILGANAIGALIGPYLLPKLAANSEKKSIAIGLTFSSAFMSTLPVLLRLAGLFPENGTDALFWILLIHGVADVGLIAMLISITWSLVSDVVEEAQLTTGRRNEGITVAGVTFAYKSALGLGAGLSGVILDVVDFPMNASDGVSEKTLFDLGMIFGPVLMAIYFSAAIFLRRYTISRSRHDHAVVELGLARDEEASES
jgi:GPH family glycoside/pentoside/hexuronide:cation symporter